MLGLVIVLSMGLYYFYGQPARVKLHVIRRAPPRAAAKQKNANERLIAVGGAATPMFKIVMAAGVSAHGPEQPGRKLNAALADALHGPLITLRSKSCTVRSLLTSVCAAAGLGCQLPRNCNRLSEHFEVRIQRALFWSVLVHIAAKTGLSPESEYGPLPGLVFSRHGLFSNGARVAVNGALAVVIESASLKSAKNRTKFGQRGYDCQLDCNTLWLPFKKAFVQIGIPKVVSASEHSGQSLLASGGFFTPGYYGVPVGQIISGYPGTLNIGPIPRGSHGIQRLAMNAPVAVSLNPEIQSANNLNSGRAEIDADGMRFLFGRPKLAKGKWGVTMTIITPPWLAKSLSVRAFLSRMNFFSPKPFVFTAANGDPIENLNGPGGYVKPDQYEYFYPRTSKPTGVFVKTYARLAAVNVPFVFKHISIPLAIKSSSLRQITQPPMTILQDIKVRSQPPAPVVIKQVVMLPRSHSAEATPARVANWIHDLGSRNHSVRAGAMKQLGLAGDVAEPAIKTALNGWTTPQTRQDMRDVLNKIAQGDAVRGPLVSLKLTNAPLRTILTQLCAQVGFSAGFSDIHLPIDLRRLTINVQRQPFWKVIQRIATLTGVVPAENDVSGGAFSFYRPGSFNPSIPMYTHGSLLLAVESSSVWQTMNFDVAPGHRTVGGFGVDIHGFWALGSSRIVKLGPVKFSRAVDNQGRPLLASKTASVMVPFSATNYEFSFGPDLRWPPADSVAIRDLQGQLPITLAVAPHTRQVGALSSGKASIRGTGIRIGISKPTGVVEDPSNPRHDICAITVSVQTSRSGTDAPGSKLFMQSLPQNTAFGYTPNIGGMLGFKSKSGRNLWCRMWKQAGGPGWNYKVFVRGGPPVTAWAKFYSHFVRVNIPFDFHNLPIPASSGAVAQPRAAPSPKNPRLIHPPELTMPAVPRPAASKTQISAWIQQLADSGPASQPMAMRHLITVGNPSVPLIQSALRHAADPSERRQFLVLLDAIAARHDLRGPLGSLNLKHASVRTAINQLCSQVGISPYYNQSLVWPKLLLPRQNQSLAGLRADSN